MCKDLRICSPAPIPKPKLLQRVRMASHAVMSLSKIWKKKKIYVCFLDGDTRQHEMVMAGAYKWASVCGVEFGFVDDVSVADIRVSFELVGAWSTLGTDAKTVTDKTFPTMNFGFLDLPTVLHEFGHALGFNHEHQNPDGGIKWKRAKVIAALKGAPNYWNIEQIKHNVLNKLDESKVKFSVFDPKSIMLYFFPDEWTVDGKGTKQNETLSETDIEWARKFYPMHDRKSDQSETKDKKQSNTISNGVFIFLGAAILLAAWFAYGLKVAS